MSNAETNMKFLNATTRKIERITSNYYTFGYVITGEAIEGMEELFAATLQTGFDKLVATFEFNAKTYGYRGRSKAALAALHRALPYPCDFAEPFAA